MKTLTFLSPDQIREEAENALVTATSLVVKMEDPRIRHHQEFLEGKLAMCRRNIQDKAGMVRGECAQIIDAANRLMLEVSPKPAQESFSRTQAPKSDAAKRQQMANRAARDAHNRESTNVQKGKSPTHVKQKGKK